MAGSPPVFLVTMDPSPGHLFCFHNKSKKNKNKNGGAACAFSWASGGSLLWAVGRGGSIPLAPPNLPPHPRPGALTPQGAPGTPPLSLRGGTSFRGLWNAHPLKCGFPHLPVLAPPAPLSALGVPEVPGTSGFKHRSCRPGRHPPTPARPEGLQPRSRSRPAGNAGGVRHRCHLASPEKVLGPSPGPCIPLPGWCWRAPWPVPPHSPVQT